MSMLLAISIVTEKDTYLFLSYFITVVKTSNINRIIQKQNR